MTANRSAPTPTPTPMPTIASTANCWLASPVDMLDEIGDSETGAVGMTVVDSVDGAAIDGADVEEATWSFCHRMSMAAACISGPSKTVTIPS